MPPARRNISCLAAAQAPTGNQTHNLRVPGQRSRQRSHTARATVLYINFCPGIISTNKLHPLGVDALVSADEQKHPQHNRTFPPPQRASSCLLARATLVSLTARSVVFPVLKLQKNEAKQYVFCSVWLPLLGMVALRVICVAEESRGPFFLSLSHSLVGTPHWVTCFPDSGHR